jgi:hypothetical protein
LGKYKCNALFGVAFFTSCVALGKWFWDWDLKWVQKIVTLDRSEWGRCIFLTGQNGWNEQGSKFSIGIVVVLWLIMEFVGQSIANSLAQFQGEFSTNNTKDTEEFLAKALDFRL